MYRFIHAHKQGHFFFFFFVRGSLVLQWLVDIDGRWDCVGMTLEFPWIMENPGIFLFFSLDFTRSGEKSGNFETGQGNLRF